MPAFVKGMELCRQFFQICAQPIIDREFPGLMYSAGLLGYGSDILGYDDPVSTDHMWGPRFYLFLPELSKKEALLTALCRELPVEFMGYSVNFSAPDPNDGGVRVPQPVARGPVSPLVFADTFAHFLQEYLGISSTAHLTLTDWISISEHKLLAVSAGQMFYDGLGLTEKMAEFSAYPEPVRMYLIASCWSLIGEEQAFAKRTAAVGDDLGSRIITARMCERLMRLCFLYQNRYAPYSKWLGTAFARLNLPDGIRETITAALKADAITVRENALAEAQKRMADYFDSLCLTEPVNAEITGYFGRDIKVIHPDAIVEKILKAWPQLHNLPLIGTMSQIGNFTCISDHTKYRERLLALYR